MSLTEAADRLGVHPGTLRRWSDDGEIRCTRTPGGHRRFREEDVQTFLNAREQPASPETHDVFAQTLLTQTRHEMATERVERQRWHAAFDQDDLDARRESGRLLLGLALQYTLRTTGREAILERGRRIGSEYGQDAVARGLSLVETVRAFFFFRETLIRSTRPGLSTRGQYDAEDVHIHRSLREFLDHVFFAALEGYETAARHTLCEGVLV
ncbi:MAG: helix-turn-helix domain-containing protein [Anaerolineae bacterium]|nr:helix-turn-helix domain-containing protein [Anaerolineae bacterium]